MANLQLPGMLGHVVLLAPQSTSDGTNAVSFPPFTKTCPAALTIVMVQLFQLFDMSVHDSCVSCQGKKALGKAAVDEFTSNLGLRSLANLEFRYVRLLVSSDSHGVVWSHEGLTS